MGATCGVIKTDKHNPIVKILRSPRLTAKTNIITLKNGTSSVLGKFTTDLEQHQLQENTLDCKVARIGYYFMEDVLEMDIISKKNKLKYKKRIIKWHRMANYNVSSNKSPGASTSSATTNDQTEDCTPTVMGTPLNDAEKGLENFLKDYPKIFHRRICKGPPPQYRWLAWKVASKMKKQVIKGLYEEELLIRGTSNEWQHSIEKDLNRTFPEHIYFSLDKYGQFGQNALRNVLKAYSLYNTKVGYCQGMNFIIGFLLMISAGNEEETFWMFCALTKTNFNESPKFDGLEGFYMDEFPLLHLFMFQFEEIFKEKMPDLKAHFDNLYLPNAIWLQKWFISLFLYSFPLNLCIRIWDNLMVQGMSYLFKVSIAILKIAEKDLLTKSIEDINSYLKLFIKGCGDGHVLPDCEIIIKKANKIRISEKVLLDLKEKYYSGKVTNHTVRSIPSRQPNTIIGAQSASPEVVPSDKENANEEVKVEDVKNSDSEGEENSKRDDIQKASDTLSHVNSQDIFYQRFESHIITYDSNNVTQKSGNNTPQKRNSLQNNLFDVKIDSRKYSSASKEELKLPPIHPTRNNAVFSTHKNNMSESIDINDLDSSRYGKTFYIQTGQLDQRSKESLPRHMSDFGRPLSAELIKNINLPHHREPTPISTFRGSLDGKRFGNYPYTLKPHSYNSKSIGSLASTPKRYSAQGRKNSSKFSSNSMINNNNNNAFAFHPNNAPIYMPENDADEIEERIEGEEEDNDHDHEGGRKKFRIEDIDDMLSEDQGEFGSTWLRADSDLHVDSIIRIVSNPQHVLIPGLLSPGSVLRKVESSGVTEINSSNVLSFVQKLPI